MDTKMDTVVFIWKKRTGVGGKGMKGERVDNNDKGGEREVGVGWIERGVKVERGDEGGGLGHYFPLDLAEKIHLFCAIFSKPGRIHVRCAPLLMHRKKDIGFILDFDFKQSYESNKTSKQKIVFSF
jgi:hypothetical protein